MSISPLGKSQGEPVHEVQKSKKAGFTDEAERLTVPENSGDASSPDKVLRNCEQLSKKDLPDGLREIREMVQKLKGRIPSGPLAIAAGNTDKALRVLSAMFRGVGPHGGDHD